MTSRPDRWPTAAWRRASRRWWSELKRGDGTTFLAELSATRTTDGRLLSIVRDITSRREAEMASRRAEESFRALLDVLPDAVVVHRGGIIVYVNATTAKLLGYGRPSAWWAFR